MKTLGALTVLKTVIMNEQTPEYIVNLRTVHNKKIVLNSYFENKSLTHQLYIYIYYTAVWYYTSNLHLLLLSSVAVNYRVWKLY